MEKTRENIYRAYFYSKDGRNPQPYGLTMTCREEEAVISFIYMLAISEKNSPSVVKLAPVNNKDIDSYLYINGNIENIQIKLRQKYKLREITDEFKRLYMENGIKTVFIGLKDLEIHTCYMNTYSVFDLMDNIHQKYGDKTEFVYKWLDVIAENGNTISTADKVLFLNKYMFNENNKWSNY